MDEKLAGIKYQTGYIGTAYDPRLGGINTEGDPTITATSTKWAYGRTIAVAPLVIPYGSVVAVHAPGMEKYNGIYLAEDTGGAIRNENGGKRVDMLIEGKAATSAFGRRPIEVAILERGDGPADARAKAKNWPAIVAKYGGTLIGSGGGGSAGGGLTTGDSSSLNEIGKAFQYNQTNMVLGTSPDVSDDQYPEHRYANNPFVLRIGDTQMFIPPINIKSSKVTMVNGKHTLRSKSPTVTKSGWTTNKLEINLIFADTDQINGWKIPGPGGLTYHMDGLRSLLAQFYKNPFLPIRNELINDRLGIFNVALYNINISTQPGFPGMLMVDLSLIECTMEAFLGLPDFMYDLCFNYPLWRWFYQQTLLDDEMSRLSGTYLRPVPKHMTGDVFFRVLDPDSIEKMKTDVLNKARQNANEQGRAEQTNLEYALYQFKMNDIAALMTDWEMGEIVCANVMVGINKELTPIQMETYEAPMFQDVGGINRVFVMDFVCTNREQLESLHAFVRHNELMAREHRHRFVGGFVEVHNEIVNMCGIQHAMVTGIETTTVGAQSEIFTARISFQEFNVNQKNNERLQGINSTLETFVDRMGKDFEDVFHIENKTDRKPVIVYEGMMEHAIKQMELYPDLELPSYNTVDKAVTQINAFRVKRKQSKMPFDKLPRPAADIWCEPDFYMIYPQIEDAFRAINAGDLGGKMVQLLIDGTYEDMANLDDGPDSMFDFSEMASIPDRLSYNFVDNSFNPYEAQEAFKEKVSIEIAYANMDYVIDAFTDWGMDRGIPNESELASMMMHDMIRYDARYRLSRAFPTYMLLFVDEGQWVDGKKLWNTYYAYHAIHEISIVRDKDNPVDLAYLRLANTYGAFNRTTKLTDPRSDMNLHSKNAWERTKGLWDSFWNFSAEDVMVESRQIMEHAELNEGARIHIRLGYSSNTGNLPICFNGHIAQINDGPDIEIVAQGDGAELIAHPVSTKSGEGTPNEAHNAFQKYLTKRQNHYFFSISEHFEFFNNFESKYGIEHFGWVESLAGGEAPEFWQKFWKDSIHLFKLKKYENEDDGKDIARFFNNVIVDNLGFMSSVVTGTPDFNVYDVMKNIYRGSFEPMTGVINYESFNWTGKDFVKFGANNIERWKQMFDGEKNVNFSAFNKTLWDIGQQFSMFVPEFICATHHHGFRSTLFFGMPHWPVKYEYYKRPGKPVLDIKSYSEKYKPFQQMHMYVAGMDIIHNNIQASSEYIRHVATGIYSRGDLDNVRTSVTVYADRSILSEQQKGMIVDTGVFQDLFGHDASIDFIMKYIAKPVITGVVGLGEVIVDLVADGLDILPFDWAEDAATTIKDKMKEWDIYNKTNDYMSAISEPGKVAAESVTIGALQRNFMQMYQGELILLGDPSVKPWDIFYLNDPERVMSGTAQVGKVTHMMSRDSGFTTVIKPDLLVSRTDGRGGRNAVIQTATYIATAAALVASRKLAATKVFRVLLGATVKMPWNASKKVLDKSGIKRNIVYRTATATGEKVLDLIGDKGSKIDKTKWLKKGLKLVKGNIFLALLTGGISEYLMTWWDKETKYNNVIYIYPLWKGGQPFAAGIKGAAHIIPNYIDPRFSDPKGAGIPQNMSSTIGAGGNGKNSNGKYDGSLSGLIHPLMGPTSIASSYGMRTLSGVRKMHNGTDIAPFKDTKGNAIKTNIYAIADGVVDKVTVLHATAGNWVIIKHSNFLGKGLYYSGYMHMVTGSMEVKVGDKVEQGKKIGIMGTTGAGSTGVHLHLEILKGSRSSSSSVDPVQFYKSMGATL